MLWADTTAGIMKMRNGANSAWTSLWELDGTFIATDISLSAGTAGAPSLYFTGDTNTGIYSPGADQVAFSTGGSGKIFIAADGKLGVLTASPTTALSVAGGISGTGALNISGSGWGVLPYVANSLVIDNNVGETRFFATGADATTKGSFIFYNGETDGGTTAAMVIDTSSRVGIGTTSPAYPLSVKSTTASGQSIFDLNNEYAGNYGGLRVHLGNTDRECRLEATYNSSFFTFYTAASSGSGTERARIDSSGRLLVGTSSARANLYNSTFTTAVQVEGTSYNTTGMLLTCNINDDSTCSVLSLVKSRGTTVGSNTLVSSGDTVGAISFAGNDGTEFVQTALIKAEVDGTPGANDMPGRLVFSTTADGAASPTERWRIDSSGSLVGVAGSAFVAPYVYNTTTATAANVNVDASGFLRRSTSSIKYKTNVETIQDQYADAILGCRPVWYQSTCEADKPDWGHWGFIAEEVAAIDPRLCFFKEEEDGTLEPEGVQYDRFVPHLLNLIKRQGEAIADLQAEVAALKGA